MYGLARHLKWTRALDDIVALRGNMRLGTVEQSDRLAESRPAMVLRRQARDPEQVTAGTLTRFAENVFISLLVFATNPAALRLPVLRRYHKLVYLSRAARETRYAPAAMLGCKQAGGEGQW